MSRPVPPELAAQLVAVYDAHGTPPAVEWAAVSPSSVRRAAEDAGRQLPGRGHPDLAELARRAPRFDCPCPMCDDVRERAHDALRELRMSDEASEAWRTTRPANVIDPDPTWRLFAACAVPRIDTAIFYTGVGESTRPAKTVCAGCSARPACLRYALDNHELFGVWGGLSERQRRRVRQSAAAA